MTAFACIFVPDFPVQALLRVEPDLRSQAVAVLEGKAPLEKVFAVSEQARCAGVEMGMTKLQVEACPELVLRTRSPLQENSAHAALLDCAQLFSPCIEDAGCDTIILDLAGMESLFGPLPKIAHDIARRASDFGFEANVAVAANPDAAVIAARGFPGITVIAEGKEGEQLGSLPVEVLLADGCGLVRSQILHTLGRWGIRNRRSHRHNSFISRAGTAAGRAEWAVSSSFARAGKTRAHAGSNCRHCGRKQSWRCADDGYTSSAGISNAAIHAGGCSTADLCS